jgi:hypothetical protein
MKKTFNIFIMAILSLLASCDSFDHSVGDLEDRLETMENGKIVEIEQQISYINGSIYDLWDVHEFLLMVISELQTNITSYTDIYESLLDDDVTKKDLELKINTLNELVGQLKDKNNLLENKITNLEKYIAEEILELSNWEETTFATLNHYNDLQYLIVTINLLIEEYKAALEDENFGNVNDSFNSLEDSMKKWVNESIAGCYDEIVALSVKLDVLADKVVTNKELADAVVAQQQELEKAKQALEDALNDAIVDAIKNSGIISNKIKETIDDANSESKDKIAAIIENLNNIKDRLTAFEKRIQSIRFLPDYANDKVVVEQQKNTTLRFMVSPVAATEGIKAEHISAYLSCVNSVASGEAASKVVVVESVSATKDGILTVMVNCDLADSYFDHTNLGNICIKINDENNDVISEWIPVMWDYRVLDSEANNYPQYEVYTDKGLLKWLYMYNSSEGKANLSLMKDITIEQYEIEKDEVAETYYYTKGRITTTNGTSVNGSNWKTVNFDEKKTVTCTFNHAIIEGNDNIISGIRSNDGTTFAGSNSSEGVIRNLILDDIIISSDVNVGAFVQTNMGVIENSEVKGGSIICIGLADVCAGSIAGVNGDGENGGIIRNCLNYAIISSKGKYTGGMIGKVGVKGIVHDCINYGNVKSEGSYVGGVIGYSYVIVSNLTNYGNIVTTDKNGHAGGILGNNDELFVGDNCNNYGSVTIG